MTKRKLLEHTQTHGDKKWNPKVTITTIINGTVDVSIYSTLLPLLPSTIYYEIQPISTRTVCNNYSMLLLNQNSD